jgi:hypothetical protein
MASAAGSKVLTFLAKLGKYLAEGVAVAAGVAPLVAPLFGSKASGVTSTVGTVTNDLTAVGGVIVQAEALLQGTGTGPQKLAAAAPLVANIVKTSELVSGHQVANNTLFVQGCTDLTNAVAEILNSLSPNSVNSTGTAIQQPVPTVNVSPVPSAISWK